MSEVQALSQSELQSVTGGMGFLGGFVIGFVGGGLIIYAGYKTGEWLMSDSTETSNQTSPPK